MLLVGPTHNGLFRRGSFLEAYKYEGGIEKRARVFLIEPSSPSSMQKKVSWTRLHWAYRFSFYVLLNELIALKRDQLFL